MAGLFDSIKAKRGDGRKMRKHRSGVTTTAQRKAIRALEYGAPTKLSPSYRGSLNWAGLIK